MVRPLLEQCHVRSRCVCVYLTKHEFEIIDQKAKQTHQTLSGFLRDTALTGKVLTVPVINAQRWSELAGLASNLNQLVKQLHQGQESTGLSDLLHALQQEVSTLRQALISPGRLR